MNRRTRLLILATLQPDQLKLPGLQILPSDKKPRDILSYEDSNNPRLFNFNVIWNGSSQSSFEVGFYAVDAYTGDVFDAVAEDCTGYSNKKLKLLQKKIRNFLHLTDIEYRKIKVKGPECME